VRRYVSLVLVAALALLVFAPAALAQQMDDDMMSPSASASAMSSASAMGDDQMMEDDMMSPSASAMMGSASASASALPSTGGPQVLPLLSVAALAVMVGSGLVAARLVRTNS
jgi:hypothetical protein